MRHDHRLAGHAFRLRPVAEADARFIVALRARAGDFLNRGAGTVEAQLAWLARYFERDDDFCFVVETLDGARREGLVGVYDVRRPGQTAEWGRWVLRAGSNAAVESALLVYRCAFDALRLASVRCRTLVANGSVVAFHDSCGLVRAGAEVTVDHDGTPQPAIEHVLSSADWPRVEAHLDRLASRFATTAQRSPSPALAS